MHGYKVSSRLSCALWDLATRAAREARAVRSRTHVPISGFRGSLEPGPRPDPQASSLKYLPCACPPLGLVKLVDV